MKAKIFLTTLIIGLCTALTIAQQRTINGIISCDGHPEAAVMVAIKETAITSTSNQEGKYKINLPEGKNTLVFYSPKHITQEFTIGEGYVLNVNMKKITKSDLADMSLQELLNINITTGTLSEHNPKYSPAAITTITKEQIQLTTARNLANLLEIYVPGMMLLAHQEGEKIGIRGHIAAENYKLLLLLNGKNITNMVYEGALLELDQWDMDDIEKIEVIRGPGSVTYGTGAIAGVINIITKDASVQKKMIAIGTAYDPVYRSKGGNMQFSDTYKKLGVYLFSSYRRSLGQDSPSFYYPDPNSTTDSRFLGNRKPNELKPQAYLADGLDRPQLKSYLNINYGDNFSVWTRYTQSGQTHQFSSSNYTVSTYGDTLYTDNSRYLSLRSIAISPEYKYKLSGNASITANLTYDNQEYIRYYNRNPNYPQGHYNTRYNYAFSQKRYVANLLFDYTLNNKLKLVTAYQYNRTAVKSPWNTSDDHLWIQEGVYMVSDTLTSIYITDHNSQLNRNKTFEQIGSGIYVNTHSHLLETSYKFNNRFQLLFSNRIDFPDITDMMFSPRLSIVSEIKDKHTFKLIAQRSLRMMPIRAQYLYDKYKVRDTTENKAEHESLKSVELAYLYVPHENTVIELHTFYNNVNAVGYTGYDLQFLGEMDLLGLDVEASFNINNTSFIFNHSFLYLADMNMNEALKTGDNRNNISFSDYYYYTREGIPILLESYGRGLNNWAMNSSRLIVTHKMFDNKLILHTNARVFWGFDGSYDEMRMYEEAYKNFDVNKLTQDQQNKFDQAQFDKQKADFEKEKLILEKQNAYGTILKLNASMSYKWNISEQLEVFATLYADNLLGSQIRHYVSTGSAQSYPDRFRFVKEPRTIGFKMSIAY